MEGKMLVTLPIEIYETLEKTIGKEGAKTVIKSIESTISEFTEYKLRTSKDELLDVMRKEFVTKDFFEERLNVLKAEVSGEIGALYEKTEKDKAELLGIMKQDKAELLGKIDALYEKTEKDKAELLGIMKQDKVELLGKIDALYEKTEKDKAELLGIMKQDKAELLGKIDALYEKTEKDKAELLGKIDALYEKTEKDKAEILGIVERNKLEVEKEILRIDRKFTVMFVVILFTIIFLNQNALEFIFKLLGVLR
jgi:hypothetical protein